MDLFIKKKQYKKLAGRRKGHYVLNGNKYIRSYKKMTAKYNFEGIEGENRLWDKLISSFDSEIKRTYISEDFEEIVEIIENPNYIEPTGPIRIFKEKFMHKYNNKWRFNVERDEQWVHENQLIKLRWLLPKEEILKHLGIKPFIPSVMINISPKWKSNLGLKQKIDILKNMMDKYFNETFWFQSIEYVIERGGDPKTAHVHLHAVCGMNMEVLKSVRSYIKKNSNVKRELKKYYDREVEPLNALRGHCEGALDNGASIQLMSLNTPALVEDKLEYLHEETKPPSHKNVEDERFRGLYFTSKK